MEKKKFKKFLEKQKDGVVGLMSKRILDKFDDVWSELQEMDGVKDLQYCNEVDRELSKEEIFKHWEELDEFGRNNDSDTDVYRYLSPLEEGVHVSVDGVLLHLLTEFEKS